MRAGLIAAFGLWAGAAEAACTIGDGDWIERVCFGQGGGTATYGHSILGDTPEWDELTVVYGPAGRAASDGNRRADTILPEAAGAAIFEDVAPRLQDVTGDGRLEAIVVESGFDQGARISIYAFSPEPVLLAATPHIGQRNRWYAPVGVADLDGDGAVELAFVDRPHLAKVLRVFRYEAGALVPVTSAAGVTNHRIGEPDIAGGVRDCGSGPEMIVATADWTRLLAVTLADDALAARDIGPHRDRTSFAAALACQD